MPDIFVPLTQQGSPGIMLKYGIRVCSTVLHLTIPMRTGQHFRLSTPQEFVKNLNQAGILRKFITFAAKNGVRENPADIRVSGSLLKTQLMAYMPATSWLLRDVIDILYMDRTRIKPLKLRAI